MSDWPKDIGDHVITADWECRDCGRSFDCFSAARMEDCE